MGDFLDQLFSPSGFTPRKSCGNWSPSLITVSAGSDVAIWLAYLSIPLILVFFARRREDRPPFRGIVLLFAAFILLCGTTHFLDALMFEYPLYRLAALMKFATAVVSWATVFALVSAVPKVLAFIRETRTKLADTAVHRALRLDPPARYRDYVVALLASTLAVLFRAALDPLLSSDYVFVLSLMAVVFVAWQCGFRPAMVTLTTSMAAFVFFFVKPRYTFLVTSPSDQIAIGLFFFSGVICAVLGDAQRLAQRRVEFALADAVDRRTDLEQEVALRTEAEHSLLHREGQLLEANDRLTSAQRQTSDALALLDTFFRNAPVGLAFFDANLRYVRVNEYLARGNGRPVEDHVGRSLTEVLPQYPPEVVADYRRVLETGETVRDRTLTGVRPGTGPDGIWSLNLYPVTRPDGDVLGVGAVTEDVTERLRADRQLRASEARKSAILDTAMDCIVTMDHAGEVVEFNPAAERTFGYARADAVGRKMGELIVPPRSREAHRQGLSHYLATGEGPILNRRIELVGLRADGTEFPVEAAISPIATDGPPLFTSYLRDITDRKLAEAAAAERGRLVDLRAEVSAALASNEASQAVLRRCTELLVRHLDAAFARVWTVNPAERVLELQASAGLYTHLDGPHARVPVGEFKIGRIARDGRPLLTNDVAHDPNVGDREWARREGMVAFAGYPLSVEGEVLGVLALFARRPLSDAVLADLAPLADGIAQWLSRQRAAASLRESEFRFRTLADAMPQLAWMTLPDGYIVWYNRRWYEYTGTTPEQMEGWGWQAVHDPRELPRVREKFEAAIASGEDWEDTFPLRRRDGAMRWHLSRATPLRDEAGRIVRWFGTNTDITEQREAQEVVQRNEARFRLLTEAIPQIVWNADAAGRITYFNARWLEHTGMSVERAREDGWEDAIHPDDRRRVIGAWRATVARQGDQFANEFRLKGQADGGYRWFLSVAVPVRRADGTVDQWIGSLTDIDSQKRTRQALEEAVGERTRELRTEVEERRRAEERVRESAVELTRSNGELEKFAYVASHDLQEPLRKIQAFGDRLRLKFGEALDESGRDYLARMMSSAARMRRLIDDLLTFSRVTTKGLPFARVDLNAVLADVAVDLELRISQTGAALDVGPLPTIAADPLQMQQLFLNLVGNALKFHRRDVAPRIEVRAGSVPEGPAGPDGRATDLCRITVADNGIGFDVKYLDRIFEVFQRLHGREEYEGTGVGLAICRKIVERHRGTIGAVGAKGQGATFTVTVPFEQPLMEAPANG